MDTTQWRDTHDRGKFPFAGSATLTNGSVFIADNLFADARLYPYNGTYNQFLSVVEKTDTHIVFTVADSSVGDLCRGEILLGSLAGKVVLYDFFERPVGFFLTDTIRMQPLVALPQGVYQFTADQTLFSPVVITPMPQDVVRSVHTDGSVQSGDVYLVGGRGVTLQRTGSNSIIVHVDGEPYYQLLICGESRPDAGVPLGPGNTVPALLESINMKYPDALGNFPVFAVGGPGVSRPALKVIPDESGTLTITL